MSRKIQWILHEARCFGETLAKKILGPGRRVRFTESTLRQASIWERKGPSFEKINVVLHQRSPYALKFEDGPMKRLNDSSDVPEARLGFLPKTFTSSKRTTKATFYSPAQKWVLRVSSTKEPEEREFVVDSGASMHVVSKKDLNSAELETMRTSRRPTTVMTANGEVQTKQEATVYVKQLDFFVKFTLLQETPAVLSSQKLCEEHGYTYYWTSGLKPHLIRNGKKMHCNKSNNVSFMVPGLSASSSSPTSSSTPSSSASQESISANR